MSSPYNDRLRQDVDRLLQLYIDDGDCRGFLNALPLFVDDPALQSLEQELDTAVRILCNDCVNSAAALQYRPDITDTMVYPLLVLLAATAKAYGTPLVFFVDVLHTLLNSVLNKASYVRLGRWESKNRHWWVGTANAGEGKSPGMKRFVNAMIEILAENLNHKVGQKKIDFITSNLARRPQRCRR